jgi:N-methylhydantoinase A
LRIEEARIGSREIWFEGEWWDADVYSRLTIPENHVVLGPALLEQPDTTIFIDPGLGGKVDRFGNLIISRNNV